MSEEFKPRKRRIDYKAGKLFPQEMRIIARREGKRVKPKPLDPLEMEIADLEFELTKALGRINSGRVPELIPRDEKLVVELRRKIAVLKGQLSTRKVGERKDGKRKER